MVCRMLSEPVARVELTPFGGVMTYAAGKSPSKGVKGFCVAAAGPVSNYILLLSLALPPVQQSLGTQLAQDAASANFAMLFLNLLPVLPLDGGSMVFSIGYYFFPAAKLITFLSHCGMFCGAVMLGLAVYGAAALGVVNCSLVIIGGYLIVCARRSRGNMLAENLYAVIQERKEKGKELRCIHAYAVAQNTMLLELLEPMDRAECAFFAFEDDNGWHLLDEKTVCQLMLCDPMLTAAQAFAKMSGKAAKKPTES